MPVLTMRVLFDGRPDGPVDVDVEPGPVVDGDHVRWGPVDLTRPSDRTRELERVCRVLRRAGLDGKATVEITLPSRAERVQQLVMIHLLPEAVRRGRVEKEERERFADVVRPVLDTVLSVLPDRDPGLASRLSSSDPDERRRAARVVAERHLIGAVFSRVGRPERLRGVLRFTVDRGECRDVARTVSEVVTRLISVLSASMEIFLDVAVHTVLSRLAGHDVGRGNE